MTPCDRETADKNITKSGPETFVIHECIECLINLLTVTNSLISRPGLNWSQVLTHNKCMMATRLVFASILLHISRFTVDFFL